jgi:hypothetical protein
MSVVEQIAEIGSSVPELLAEVEVSGQLRDLEEVEAVLKAIGVSLEPRFDVSLAARIGAVTPRK